MYICIYRHTYATYLDISFERGLYSIQWLRKHHLVHHDLGLKWEPNGTKWVCEYDIQVRSTDASLDMSYVARNHRVFRGKCVIKQWMKWGSLWPYGTLSRMLSEGCSQQVLPQNKTPGFESAGFESAGLRFVQRPQIDCKKLKRYFRNPWYVRN